MFAIQQYCSFISDFWSIRFKSFTEPHPKMLKDLVSAHKNDCFSFVELTTEGLSESYQIYLGSIFLTLMT